MGIIETFEHYFSNALTESFFEFDKSAAKYLFKDIDIKYALVFISIVWDNI